MFFNKIQKKIQESPSNWHQKAIILGVISSLNIATPSLGAIANFDSLDPGFLGTNFTDNGITFSNLIAGFRISPPEFLVKSGNQFNSVFSTPNYLTFGSSTNFNKNGGQPVLGGFGSMNITPGETAQSVSLDVLTINPSFGANNSLGFPALDNSLVLEAFFQGQSVASTSVLLSEFSELNPSGQYWFSNLSLSGVVFDELQLYTPIAFADGVIPLGLDNVSIINLETLPLFPIEFTSSNVTPVTPILIDVVDEATSVPESQPLTALGLLLTGFLGYLGRKRVVRAKA